ncbi:hypothetical protein ACTJKN_02725 [Pedobacter sp. 22163]|uniref:hypothetical protein n=1 Tax=Pedobacter sp. 22163 TaxID=3453883 RepID=UPI003F84BBDC
MKSTAKKLQKRTLFIFKSVNQPIRSTGGPTTTSTDPTTVLTTTANTDVLTSRH